MRRLAACALFVLTPAVLLAREPARWPRERAGFQMFSGALGRIRINQVDCQLSNSGQWCADGPGSSIGGGFWPKGTANMYFFNSGPQIAGIIGPDGGPWADDTSGAFFFDNKGTTLHGQGITDIYDGSVPGDISNWPAAAFVPGGAEGSIYHSSLHGRASASQGDAWWIMWEGSSLRLAGRAHPLGIAAEVRVLGWNFPAANEDILYVVTTYYNISSLDPADYAPVRPEMRNVLLQQAAELHRQADEELGVVLPSGGYTINDFYAGVIADPDVANAGTNYASVNVPFSMSYSWDASFPISPYWTFDPRLHSSPFFPGFGLGGIVFLTLPSGGGLHVFSTSTNGGPDFPAALNVAQLFRFLSGNPSTALDGACNFNPQNQKICTIRQTSPSDIRTLQSTGPVVLAPGQFVSQVSAYVFAAPVRTGGSLACPACDIKPGSASIIAGLDDPTIVAQGVNPIDSIAGFLSASDLSGDGSLQMDEFISVPRSLYAKAQLAQAMLDNEFLVPTAPAPPEFFLVPGDNQVTVLWRPSVTEEAGDPYFTVAKDARVMNDQGVLVPNPLYDPNFRQFDVEGYRVYRGRVDDPAAMTLVAQFDYAGTVISDYAGQVNPSRFCAPELGIALQCGVGFDPVAAGQSRTVHVDVPLIGIVEQIRFGDRFQLVDGSAFHARSDTVGKAGNELIDIGVPFVFVDNTVRNNFRYFYTVTAFDVNSWQSGPSSLESPRVVKSALPVRAASNYANEATVSSVIYGRGVPRTDAVTPTLDPSTGVFSKPFPPTRDWSITLENLVPELIGEPGGLVSVFLDSLALGDAYGAALCTASIPAIYYLRVVTPSQSTSLTLPLVQSCFDVPTSISTSFDAVPVNPELASRFGGNTAFAFRGTFTATLAGNYYTNSFGRGCLNSAPGFAFANTSQSGCDYNGARWFDGPSPASQEAFAHPNGCSAQNFTSGVVTCFRNAGFLSDATNIYEAKAYQTTVNVWRQVEGALGAAVRGTDYNVHWGAGGRVDSVIDVTYNVPVPFNVGMGASWGFLNASAAQPSGVGLGYDQRVELTLSDFGCVEPFRSLPGPQVEIACGSTGIGDGPVYQLSPTAIPGSIAFFTGPIADNRTHNAAPDLGIAMAMPGHIFLFELNGGQLPSAGTVWTLRDYVGAIRGGGNGCALCQAGADGDYRFSSTYSYRPIAVGSEIRLTVDVVNRVNAPTLANLETVHTVPDPYYLTSEFENDGAGQIIKFVNLPQDAVIRVYSSSGVLVTLLEHHSTTFGGAKDWNVRNRTGRRVASGVYFYHIEAGDARRVGRLTIVNNRPGF